MSSSLSFGSMAQRLIAAGLATTLSLAPLTGCAGSQTSDTVSATVSTDTTSSPVSEAVASSSLLDTASLFSDRDLDASYDASAATSIALADGGTTVEGAGVTVDGSTVTITQEGTYVVSGTLSQGQLVVNAPDAKVQIVLAGASITHDSSAALYVPDADKVFVTLAEGTDNSLSVSGDFVAIDDNNIDGALFCKDDLTINGSGSLAVSCASAHGIVVKDDLTLTGGTVTVEAAKHAIETKGGVAVSDGTYTLTAGKDGLHTEDSDEYETANVYLAGGSLTLTAGVDGIDAGNVVQIDGGTLTVAAADDGVHAEYDLLINGGTINVSESNEAFEGARITVNGGDVDVTASDDGLNASGEPTDTEEATTATTTTSNEQGQDATGAQGQDATGEGADASQMPQRPEGGEAPSGEGGEPPQMPEGGQMPQGGPGGGPGGGQGTDPFGNQNGDSSTTTQDNARPMDGGAGGVPGGDMGGGGGFVNDETASLTINGGTLHISAEGDGIDSNGTFDMSGGTVYVDGPLSGGNGALDFGDGATATITGGTIVAVGSAGMAENFTQAENQGAMLVNLTDVVSGEVVLADANGTVLVSYTPSKQYQSVVVSAPGIEQGGTYTLTCGDSATEVTMDELIYGKSGMGAGGFGGGMGMQGQGGPQGGMPGQGDTQGQNGAQEQDSASSQADGASAQEGQIVA